MRARRQLILRSSSVAAAATIVLFVLLGAAVESQLANLRINERLRTFPSVIRLQTTLEEILVTNYMRLEGFRAWVELDRDPVNSENMQTRTYIDLLLAENPGYIRNIGLLEDTTIVWNHPKEGNESSIGVDLSTVESQRDTVLRVKNNGEPQVSGPVDLVQGGRGLIIRQALYRSSGYWGQMSIVLDSNGLFTYLDHLAADLGFRYAIFDTAELSNPVHGEAAIARENPLVSEVIFLNSRWTLAAIPKTGWSTYLLNRVLGYAAVSLISGVLGYLLYMLLFTRSLLRRQAIFDELTGLYNRNYLNTFGEMLLARAQRNDQMLGIILFDLNRFKPINDKYGHQAGDRVLRSVGYMLREQCRSSEMPFRIGGDEFLVLLPEIKDTQELKAAAARLEQALSLTMKFNGDEVHLHLSVGSGFFPADGKTLDAIMNSADQRMYAQKARIR